MEKSFEKLDMEDISLPQVKKAVHAVMLTCYGNEMYRQIDLIRKVIRRLKCNITKNGIARVRGQIKNWIISNCEVTKDKNGDSKKGIKLGDSKKEILKRKTKPCSTTTSNSIEEEVNEENGEPEAPETQCICACRCKKTPVVIPEVTTTTSTTEEVHKKLSTTIIDLTIDNDNDPIKMEEDDMEMDDINAVVSMLDDTNVGCQPPLAPLVYSILPYPYYLSYMPYYNNVVSNRQMETKIHIEELN